MPRYHLYTVNVVVVPALQDTKPKVIQFDRTAKGSK